MKKLLFILLMLWVSESFAQQDFLFTQYSYNKLLVNPAYAGSKDRLNATLLHRTQWVGLEGAPETSTLSIHTPIRNRKVGLGLIAYRDAIGPIVNSSLMGTYSYRIFMGNGSLAFGIQAGFKHSNFDLTKIDLNESDHVFQNHKQNDWDPDVNVGVYYQTYRFFLGLSARQLIENEYRIEGNSISKQSKHYYLMGGMIMDVNKNIIFRPSALIKYEPNSLMQLDVNASFIFNNIITIGASYRTRSAMTLLCELALSQDLKLGYSYDRYFNDINSISSGSHEFRLEFSINLFKSRMRTPRYF